MMGLVAKLACFSIGGVLLLTFCQAAEPNTACKCTRELDPVCGINGRTYPNACLATCDNAEVKHEGPCEAEHRHAPCPLNELTVCGTDGKTYGNECFCKAAGVAKAYDGPCKGEVIPPVGGVEPAFTPGDEEQLQRGEPAAPSAEEGEVDAGKAEVSTSPDEAE